MVLLQAGQRADMQHFHWRVQEFPCAARAIGRGVVIGVRGRV